MNTPTTLTSSLRDACSRVTRLRTGKILLLWGAFLLGTLFLLVGLDIWASIESRPLRWILSGTAWLAWSIVLVRGLLLVVKRRPKFLEMARYLEDQHPEWQESVSTTLELKKSGGVSPGVLGQIERQAVSSVREVRAPAEFPGAALKPAGRLLGAAALLMAALFALWPQAAWMALKRVLMPWDDPGNAFTLQLEVTPGDQILPEGASLGIQARLKGEDGAMAMLVCEFADGRTTRERMPSRPAATNAVDGTSFALELPDLRRSFTYHVLAGRARSKPYQVQVEPLPDLKDLQAVITPPVYSGLAVSTNTWTVEPLAALVGSRVRLEAALNKPVRQASHRTPRGATPEGALSDGAGRAEWTFEVEPELSGEWTFRLADNYGFTNAPISRLFRAIPDLAPRISILEPRLTELEMRPTDLLHIEYAIEEDFGLGGLLLKVNRGHDNREIPQPQPVRDPASGLFRGDISLNLPDIEAKPGQTLRVRIQATDNLPAGLKGPHVVSSTELVIKITDSSGSIARQQANKMNQKMEEQINKVQQAVNDARNKAEQQANEQAKHAETPDWVKKQLENLQKEMAEAEEKIDQAVKGPEAEFHKQTAEKLEDMAEKLDAAKEKADQISLQDTAQERADLAKDVQKAMEELAKDIQPLREQFNEDRKSAEDWVRLQELADKQEQLALTAEKPKDEPQKNQWENQQRDVANQAAELVKNDPEAKTEVAETVAEQAESLAEQAEAAAKQEQKLSESSRQAAQKQNEQAEKSLGEALADQQRELAKEIAEQAKEAAQEAAAEQKNDGQTADAQKQPDADAGQQAPEQAAQDAAQQKPSAPEAAAEQKNDGQTADAQKQPDADAGRQAPEQAAQAGEAKEAAAETAAEALQEAARAAEQAARKLDQGDIPAATEAANQAAEALAKAEQAQEALAEQGSPETPSSDEGGPTPEAASPEAAASEAATEAAAQTADLKEQQQALAESMAAMKEGLAKAASEAQDSAAETAKDVSREARTLAQTAQALGEPAQRAREAAQHAQNAQGQADAAERSAEQWEQQAAQNPGNSQSAGQTADQQQAAANELRQTAQNAREVAQQAEAMAQEGQPKPADPASGDPAAAAAAAGGQTPQPPAPPQTPGRIDSEKLAEGFEAAAQAANAPTQQQAAQQAAQAATALRDAAKRDTPPALAGEPAPPGPPGSMSPGPVGSPQPGVTPRSPGAAEDLLARIFGPVSRDWANVQGTLKSGLSGDHAGKVPDDYSDLVRDYFQALRDESGKD